MPKRFPFQLRADIRACSNEMRDRRTGTHDLAPLPRLLSTSGGKQTLDARLQQRPIGWKSGPVRNQELNEHGPLFRGSKGHSSCLSPLVVLRTARDLTSSSSASD